MICKADNFKSSALIFYCVCVSCLTWNITVGIIHLLNIVAGTVVNSEFIIIGLTEKCTTFHTTKLYAY